MTAFFMPKTFSLMETVDLAYEESGSQDLPPLIILHGFFASSRNWRKIAEKLSATFHVYVLDMRNHGDSPHHAAMDYPSMTADVLRFLDVHKLNTAHVLGHSMGGKCAMWLALNHPERTGKLIVVDIAPKSYTHSFDKTIHALIDLPLAKIQNRKQAENLLARDIPELHYRQFLLQNLIFKNGCYNWRVSLDIFLQVAPNIVAFPDTQGLASYEGNVLFIAGADSTYVAQADIVGLFPHAQFEIIVKAGHWVHAQQPEVFTEVVENFLQRG
jgi:pimeloyl-ACP methyl ester carboxylesterase